jgi:hypothetical protein
MFFYKHIVERSDKDLNLDSSVLETDVLANYTIAAFGSSGKALTCI